MCSRWAAGLGQRGGPLFEGSLAGGSAAEVAGRRGQPTETPGAQAVLRALCLLHMLRRFTTWRRRAT